jgi:hypothetical protein
MSEKDFDIDNVRQALLGNRIDWTDHALDRLEDRDIKRIEVIELIMNGQIIEMVFDSFPLPKCLIMGYVRIKMPIYVSLGYDKNRKRVRVITIYWQDPDKWLTDRIRKSSL